MRRPLISVECLLTLCLTACSSSGGAADTDGASSSSSSSSSTGSDESSTGPACAALAVDLADAPCVQFGELEIGDVVDDCGFALSCTPREGPGAGRLPDGLTVRPDCAFQGNISEDRIGAWAQIVDVERDGETIPVPFCAVQAQSFSGYTVEFSPAPVFQKEFDPAGAVSLEEENPTLRVRPDTPCPADDCSSSYAFDVLNGGFSPSSVTGLGTIEDEGGSATLVQPLTASANMVAPEFATDPWVFAIEYNYCMQAEGACSLINPNTEATDAFSAFAVIMQPTP